MTVTTFTMIAFSGKRSAESERVMKEIQSREWGLLLLDEVHVVPAQMFRKVRQPVMYLSAGFLAFCKRQGREGTMEMQLMATIGYYSIISKRLGCP